MRKIPSLIAVCLGVIAVSSCIHKTPAEFAAEYNVLVDSLEMTDDQEVRKHLFKKMSDIQLDVRAELTKEEQKEFHRMVRHSEPDTVKYE